jgi:hypothetical protein
MEKSEEDLMRVRNLGKRSYDEAVEKLQSLGIEMVDGHLEFANTELLYRNSSEQTNNMDESTRIQIEEEIDNSDVLSEDEKEELRKMLDEKYEEIKAEKMCLEEERLHLEITNVNSIPDDIINLTIVELDLSVRSYNCLTRAGINTVKDIIEKSEEDLMRVRNLGKRSYDEVIEKLQSLGIVIVDEHFVYENLDVNSESYMKKMKVLEEKINSNEYISEEQKEELRKLLYEKFNVTGVDNQEIQSDLEDIESSESVEEPSKEELVKHILEQQKTIAKQREEINELSSQKKEDINE